MKYNVNVLVDGRIDVEVEANDFHEAKEKASAAAGNLDLNAMDYIDLTPVNAEDENGNFLKY